MSSTVERCTGDCLDEWVKLRRALWPHASDYELRVEAAAILERPHVQIALIARGQNAAVIAFAEATLRRDYVNGCTASPSASSKGFMSTRSSGTAASRESFAAPSRIGRRA